MLCLIIKYVALKVGQEDDLHPQSQLEPWSQIKRLLGCRRRRHGLGLPALTRSQIHTNKRYVLACIMSVQFCVLAQTNVTVWQFGEYPWTILRSKMHFHQTECCTCNAGDVCVCVFADVCAFCSGSGGVQPCFHKVMRMKVSVSPDPLIHGHTMNGRFYTGDSCWLKAFSV